LDVELGVIVMFENFLGCVSFQFRGILEEKVQVFLFEREILSRLEDRFGEGEVWLLVYFVSSQNFC